MIDSSANLRDHAVKRSLTPIFAFVLSLLLVGMQLENAVHKLGHVGERLSHSRDHSLVVPNEEPCAECVLLASGASALADSTGETPVALAAQERLQFTPASVTPAFFSYYFSRAPPRLL
jgi:hypothetical protein